MALLWIDGFEGYGTSIGSAPAPTGVLGRKYLSIANEANIDIETGRVSGYSIEFALFNCQMSTPVLTTDDTLIVGTGFRSTTNRESYIFALYDGATLGMNLRWKDLSSELQLYRGTTFIAETSGLGLAIDTWYYIELKVTCHDSTGAYEVRVFENNVLSASGVDTKEGTNNYHDSIMFRPAASASPRWDDFYVCDSTGSDNNNFLGNCKVVALYPNGDDTTGWATVSPGPNHFEAVDEEIVDNDTSYVESNTTNETDLYDYEDISDLGEIKGLQVNIDCRVTDATTYDLIIPIESNSTQYDDSGQTVGSTNWVTKMRLDETDPDTGNLWTESGVNAALIGVKVG